MATLNDAIMLASHMHKGQYDKGGHPYILHPLRVMQKADSEDEKIVAVLHDIVEDTEITIANLSSHGYSKHIVEAIDALTRRDGETYFEFIARVKENDVATKVKLLDIEDNSDITRLKEVTDADVKRLNKYKKAAAILRG